jgi:hypothetical protein
MHTHGLNKQPLQNGLCVLVEVVNLHARSVLPLELDVRLLETLLPAPELHVPTMLQCQFDTLLTISTRAKAVRNARPNQIEAGIEHPLDDAAIVVAVASDQNQGTRCFVAQKREVDLRMQLVIHESLTRSIRSNEEIERSAFIVDS